MLITLLGASTGALGTYNLIRFAVTRGIRARRRAKRFIALAKAAKATHDRLESIPDALDKIAVIIDKYGASEDKKKNVVPKD